MKQIATFLLIFLLTVDLHSQERKTVCLNMIVKNEKEVITRCLESVKPIIDYWVIVDTGSTDGTQERIRSYMKGIPGELYERQWKNFAHNRNEALTLARGKADYCLIMDADDLLQFDPNFRMPELKEGVYYLKVKTEGIAFERPQLIDLKLPWKWEGVLHEYLTCPQKHTNGHLEHVLYLDTHEGARSRDPEKFAKDAAVLEEALKTDPMNARYMFYLAQSYKDAGQIEKAIDCYETRIAMEGWEEEVYWSMYQKAELKKKLKQPQDEIVNDYFQAYRYRPTRLEALYGMVELLNTSGEYPLAYSLIKSHEFVPKNETADILFTQPWIEEWGLMVQVSVSSYYMGRYQESKDACDTLLRQKNLPGHIRRLVINNRAFAQKKIEEETMEHENRQ